MSFYSFITFAVLGFIFLSTGVDFLGWIFLIMSLVALIYNPGKSQLKKSWKQAAEAEGSYPKGKMNEYTENAAKQFGELATTYENTQYNVAKAPQKLHKASKNFWDELGKLFK